MRRHHWNLFHFTRPSGHIFDYRRAGSASSRLKPGDLKKEHFQNVKILHLSGISLAISDSACEASLRAIELAKENGVKISFDTNLRLKLWSLSRAKAIIQHVASLADFVLPGLDDARQLTGLENPKSIVEEYLKMGVGVVALTLGVKVCCWPLKMACGANPAFRST